MAGVNAEEAARFKRALANQLGLDVSQVEQVTVTMDGGDPMVKVEWTGFKYLTMDEYAAMIELAKTWANRPTRPHR